ncbi:MAG: hypothetical protein ABI211_08660 [Vicinamibacterales bacterium]
MSSEPHAASEPAGRLTQEVVEPREQAERTRGAVESRASFDESDVVLRFPVVGGGEPDWWLTSTQLREWQGLYPGIDVSSEARKALAWVLSHPERRKTPKGMPRFLVGWLGRATDRGGGRNAVVSHGKTAGNVAAALAFIERGQA